MQSMIYTGVGSRETPENILVRMRILADCLASQGFTLRSGGASGADRAFEEGCDLSTGSKEIYLPWKSFNGNSSPFYPPSSEAINYLRTVLDPTHFSRLSRSMILLHARNVHQVLGPDLSAPSKFIICWTRGGKLVGGTATALKIAIKEDIPIYNLADYKGFIHDCFS